MTLSPQEMNVAELVAEGHPDKVIAARLDISVHTVDEYLTRVVAKIGAKDSPLPRRRAITLWIFHQRSAA